MNESLGSAARVSLLDALVSFSLTLGWKRDRHSESKTETRVAFPRFSFTNRVGTVRAANGNQADEIVMIALSL